MLNHKSEEYTLGHEAGESWAAEHATKKELRRLHDARDEARRRNEWETFFEGESVYTPGENLHCLIINGDHVFGGPDRHESSVFWEFFLVSERLQNNGDFMMGFADGAAEYAAVPV